MWVLGARCSRCLYNPECTGSAIEEGGKKHDNRSRWATIFGMVHTGDYWHRSCPLLLCLVR